MKMRANEFLVEGKVDKIWKDWGRRIFERILSDRTFPEHWEKEELLDPEIREEVKQTYNNLLAQADPSKNQDYYVWITRLYLQQNFQAEDIPLQVHDALVKYHTMKIRNQLPDLKYKDINFFQTLSQLVEILPEDEKAVVEDRGKYKVLVDDETCLVVQLLDVHAAIYFGQGTNPTWCTAYPLDDKHSRNLWDNYKNSGPIYVIIPKVNKNHPNEKYQFQFPTDQIMNRSNNYITYDEMDSLINRCPIIATLFKDEILQKIKYIEHINAILPLFKNDVASQSIILFTAADNETNINFKYFSKEAFTEEVLVKLLSHWDFAKDLQRAGIPISSSVIEKALPHNLDLVYSLMKNPELINYKIASYYVENSNVSSYDQFMSCLPKSQLSEKEIYWIAKKVITEIPSEVAWIYQYVTTEGKKQNRLWNEALLIDPSVIKEITSSDEIMHDQDLLLDIVERAVNYHCDRLSRKEKSTLQLKDIPMMIFNYDTKKFQPALHENDIIDACVRMIVWDSGTINDVPEQYRQIVQKEVDEELEKSKYY